MQNILKIDIFILCYKNIYTFAHNSIIINIFNDSTSMVNLEWYRTFKAIYQQGTLTKAAEKLMISQPNASIQLSSLETYIGHPLFIRQPRKMTPTDYGKQLYTQIVDSIDNLERVEVELKKSNLKKKPTIKFGVPSEVFYSYLVENIHGLHCDIIIEYGLANELIEKLKNGTLDIAFITKQNTDIDHLFYEYMYTEQFMLVCNNNQDTSEVDSFLKENDLKNAEKWLKNQYWYAYDSNLSIIRRFWKSNFFKRPIIKPKAIIPSYNAILKAMTHSGGFAAVSDIIAGKQIANKEVKIVWKGIVPSSNNLFLAYDKAKLDANIATEILEFIKASIDPYIISQ